MAKWLSADGTKHLLEKLATVINNKANTNHTHKIIQDSNDNRDITIAYSKETLKDYTYIAGWSKADTSKPELRAIAKSDFAIAADYYKKSEIDEKIKTIAGGGTVLAQSLSIALNGGTTEGTNKFTFDGSSAKNVNVTPASIGAAASTHTHNLLKIMGTNSITAVGDDTITNWINCNSSIHLFSKENVITNQPNQYGYILNIADQGVGEIHQLWLGQGVVDLAHRAGTTTRGKWDCEWRKILDSENYKTFAVPLSGGTVTGDLNVSGSDKILNCMDGARMRVSKDSNQDPVYSYNHYSEAFYSAYSQKQFSMIMAIPAVTASAPDVGVFGIHQRLGGLYIGYLKKNGTEDDRKWFKLIDINGESSFTVGKLATAGAVTNSNYDNKGGGWNNSPISGSVLSFWSGSFYDDDENNVHNSNLKYCIKGEFGSVVTRNISHGTDAPSGSAKEGDIYIQLS